MTRRRGQQGYTVKKGSYYVVRFWDDVPGQVERVRRSVRICPIKGPGKMTKPERERRAKEIIEERGVNTAEHLREAQVSTLGGTSRGTTFPEQAQRWIRELENRRSNPVKPRTIGNFKSHLAWLLPRVGDIPLCDFKPRQAKELVAQMWAAGLKPKTINNYFFVVTAVIASARDDEGQRLYPHEWDRKFLDLPTVDKGKQNRPMHTSGVIESIISKAIGRGEYQEAILYTLLPGSGVRPGECIALQVPDLFGNSLNITKSVWNGALYDPKTSNGVRVVDLAPELAEMLRAFIGTRKDGFVFRTSTGGPLHLSNVLRRSLHPILASLGLGKAGFYGFRRYRVTWLRQHSVPEQLIDYWTGHAGEKDVTDGYSKICEDAAYRKSIAEQVGSGLPKGIFEKMLMLDPNGPIDSHLQKSAQVMVN